MTGWIVLATLIAALVALHWTRGSRTRLLPLRGYRPPEPWPDGSLDRDRERQLAELRGLVNACANVRLP